MLENNLQNTLFSEKKPQIQLLQLLKCQDLVITYQKYLGLELFSQVKNELNL